MCVCVCVCVCVLASGVGTVCAVQTGLKKEEQVTKSNTRGGVQPIADIECLA